MYSTVAQYSCTVRNARRRFRFVCYRVRRGRLQTVMSNRQSAMDGRRLLPGALVELSLTDCKCSDDEVETEWQGVSVPTNAILFQGEKPQTEKRGLRYVLHLPPLRGSDFTP